MLKLILAPDNILKSSAEEWDFSNPTDSEAVEREMIEIMQMHRGRGLAGNQVGLLKRVFVIQLENHPSPFAMFNPRVIRSSDQQQDSEEGCLSFPDLWLNIKRPQSIDAEYLDKTGKECKISLTGIDARCFLHELDHLDGVCFTDNISTLKLAMAIKKQRKRNGRTK
jgi:peptide deformylase